MNIEVSEQAGQTLTLLSRLNGTTVAQVVDQILTQFNAPAIAPNPTPAPVVPVGATVPAEAASVVRTQHDVPVYVDYAGIRTRGLYNPQSKSITIADGPLAKRYKSPSGAARAVVAHYSPAVVPERNGWSFWTVDDGNGRLLQSIR